METPMREITGKIKNRLSELYNLKKHHEDILEKINNDIATFEKEFPDDKNLINK